MRYVTVILLCLLASPLGAAVIKLYLKDGTFQLVREYKVEGDRVRYYAMERSDWEEMPISLVDIKKTEEDVRARDEAARQDAKVLAEEDKAERDSKHEVERIPMEPGVYLIEGELVKTLPSAESKIVNNRGRNVLKVLSPVPLVTGKQTLELDGLHSHNTLHDTRPQFYIRLSAEERFGIARLHDHKGNRVVENLTIIPVTKEVVEEPQLVDIFRQQIGENAYKLWPEKDLEPGEYAVIEYTEGKVNTQVWDFAYIR